MRRRLTSVVALVATTAGSVVTTTAPRALAGPGDGTLTVQVVRSVLGTGNFDAALDVGVAGIPVTVTDDAGATATGTTAADGSVRVDLAGVTGGKYRVQADIPPALGYLQPAPAGGTLSSLTEFVDVSGGRNRTVTMGVWNPADYSQADPNVVTPRQFGVNQFNGNTIDPNGPALYRWPYSRTGNKDSVRPTVLATQAQTGSTYGVGYQRTSGSVYVGALAKAHTDYGPGGIGAIYRVTSGGAISTFAQLSAGTTAHPADKIRDGSFLGVPGKQSIGDVEVSEDGTKLYAVNLFTKQIAIFPLNPNGTSGGGPTTVDIPDPGCTGGVWRPFGLAQHDGKLYVGGVCDASTSGATANLSASVYAGTVDGTGFTRVLSQPLTFKRGRAAEAPSSDRWRPWSDAFNPALWTQGKAPNGNIRFYNNPQPILSDIVFDRDGSMVLGFRDRFADQLGYGVLNPNVDDGLIYVIMASGGDTNRACLVNGSYTWEGTAAACPNNAAGEQAGITQDPDVSEFYYGDFTPNAYHSETTQGGLAFAPRFPDTLTTGMDPAQGQNGQQELDTGGVMKLDNTTGAKRTNSGYTLHDFNQRGSFSKGNGLGDLELLADNAPVQIGNRVWYDTDRDGIQDPSETPLPGATVTLLTDNGTPVSTKTTNTNGEYYFGTADGVEPNTAYQVRFDPTTIPQSALPPGVTPAQLTFTTQKAGTDPRIDSDPITTTGTAQLTLAGPGTANHTIDAGLTAPPTRNTLGDFVWQDKNRNGRQDPDEPGAQGVKVELLDCQAQPVDGNGDGTPDTTTTDANGKYLFPDLLDGCYQVRFTKPDGTDFTTQNTGQDDTTDSDANPQTGISDPTTLGPDNRSDLTIDAGLITSLNSLGDYVWRDLNRNGLQDNDEPAAQGVKVELLDCQAQPVDGNGDGTPDTTTTDANGKYLFPDLVDGCYQVRFTKPDGTEFTTQNAGQDDTVDSDVDPTGLTGPTTLGPDKRSDLTIDAGLVTPLNSLGDYVWRDLNRNGLQDNDEPGVQGIKVELLDCQAQPVDGNGDGTPDTTTTDANGKYLFPDLADGCYQVRFTKPDGTEFTTQNAGQDDTVDSDADATGLTGPTTLGPDKRSDLTIDAGLVTPLNSLGDYVWRDLNRNGLQDSGEPAVQGVKVELLDCQAQPVDGNGDGTPDTATTDANGKYLFSDLVDGCYQVRFTKPDGTEFTTQNAGQDDTVDSDADATGLTGPTTLGQDKRSDLTIDAGLVTPLNSMGDYVWRDLNRNGLQDDEPGVQGVKVELLDCQAQPVDGNGDGTPDTATTDANGKYLFSDLVDGCYQVRFTKPDGTEFTTQNAGQDDTVDSDVDPTGLTGPTTLGPDKRSDLTIDAGLVTPLNSLGDFVWQDKNRNGFQDDGEPGVQGVKVELLDCQAQPVDGNGDGTPDTTTTDANGKYLFPDLVDGCYQVRFTKPDGTDFTTQNAGQDDTVDSDADPTGLTGPTTLGPDKRSDLTIDAGLVTPLNSLGDFVWQDKNRNGLQDDEPGVQGVKVELLDCQAQPVDGNGDGTPDTATTDANGKYLFSDLVDGCYQVRFTKPDGTEFTTQNAGQDDTVDSDVDPTSGISGQTTLGPDKRSDLTLDAGLVTPLNSLGDFVWRDLNRNGRQDADEPGVQGVRVELLDCQGQPTGQTQTTDANGKYLFTDLPDGCYQVRFTKPDGTDFTTQNAGQDDTVDSDADPTGLTGPTTLGPDKRSDLTIDAGLVTPLNSLGDYVWRDLNRNGRQDTDEPGVQGVRVELLDCQGQPTGQAQTTDANGKYLFTGLPDGCYQVRVTKPDGTEFTTQNTGGDDSVDSDVDPATGITGQTTLGPDKRSDLTIDAGLVTPLNTIGDRVWRDDNRDGVQNNDEPGVPNVKVDLLTCDDQPTGRTTTTDANGKYLFTGLPDGCYKVKVTPPPGTEFTQPNAGQDDTVDSDVVPATGVSGPVTVGPDNRTDLTVDAGVITPVTNQIGDFVWEDRNTNGLQDPDEPGVPGVTARLHTCAGTQVATTMTGPDGKYLFPNLPEGSYTVTFDPTTADAKYRRYTFTKPNVGETGRNSVADPATGRTGCVELKAGNRSVLTVDAGLIAPAGPTPPNPPGPKPPAPPRPGKPGPLPNTGADVEGLIGLAALALIGGGAALAIGRRRRRG